MPKREKADCIPSSVSVVMITEIYRESELPVNDSTEVLFNIGACELAADLEAVAELHFHYCRESMKYREICERKVDELLNK